MSRNDEMRKELRAIYEEVRTRYSIVQKSAELRHGFRILESPPIKRTHC